MTWQNTLAATSAQILEESPRHQPLVRKSGQNYNFYTEKTNS